MAASFSLTPLAELLRELFEQVREGVLLCDAAGSILAANRSAGHQLGRISFAAAGIDKIFAEPYISRARAYVRHPSHDSRINFLCPKRDGNRLFDCRLCWYEGGEVDSPFYLLTFKEALSAENHSRSEGWRCDSIGKLRQPLANLKAAAENLLAYPDMSPVMRSAFENVIAQESVSLTRTFDDLAGQCAERTGICEPGPVNGEILVGRVLSLAGCPPELIRPSPDDPQNLMVDERWLQQLLLALLEFLSENKISLSEIRFCSEPPGRFVYLEMLWEGYPFKAAEIEEWRRLPLSRVPGSPSGADILRGHGSELWSQEAEKSGFALIRLPLPLVLADSDNG